MTTAAAAAASISAPKLKAVLRIGLPYAEARMASGTTMARPGIPRPITAAKIGTIASEMRLSP